MENKGDLVKIGISAAIIILAVYIYFAFSPSNKNRIQVYVVPFSFGADPSAPISSSNPADPKSIKDYVSYQFSDYSGKVQVLVHPNNATIQPEVSFKPSPESLHNKPYLTWL
ncbi:MAG TPA: hypothetical protein VKJ65_01750, partial [Phycisphaerae bacterium]|nr:hypothetical protein [Phycisphaerae bacterium]